MKQVVFTPDASLEPFFPKWSESSKRTNHIIYYHAKIFIFYLDFFEQEKKNKKKEKKRRVILLLCSLRILVGIVLPKVREITKRYRMVKIPGEVASIIVFCILLTEVREITK